MIVGENPDLMRVQAVYAAAVALRDNADPLLIGQIEAIIGRLSALLAAMGAPVPDDAVPTSEAPR